MITEGNLNGKILRITFFLNRLEYFVLPSRDPTNHRETAIFIVKYYNKLCGLVTIFLSNFSKIYDCQAIWPRRGVAGGGIKWF
jgi:hypothetical protein